MANYTSKYLVHLVHKNRLVGLFDSYEDVQTWYEEALLNNTGDWEDGTRDIYTFPAIKGGE